MLLVEIKNHLKAQHTASMFEISNRFNVEPEVLRDMLGILIRKGQVRMCPKTPQCGTKCSRCNVLMTEIYEWVEQ